MVGLSAVACAFAAAAFISFGDAASSDGHFMVQVQYDDGNGGKSLCNGALVTKSHVATLASCASGDISKTTVFSGTALLWKTGKNGTAHAVKTFKKHPKFSLKNAATIQYYFDVAVFKLQKPVSTGAQVSTIELGAVGSLPAVGKNVRLAGFGTYDFSKDITNKLRLRVVQIQDKAACGKQFGVTIPSDEFCTVGDPDNGKSGTSVFANDKLYGLMSWGSKVFVDVTNPEINSFIKEQIKSL
ncbi:hypothetical protein ONE63_000055 [Megalurothrips usitatus]|uniref:Peptidase S1 domain-containing protein n=1 Tax=Megalurothrips usitatus TaxID=439358 RepID=A0AAV7XXA3_9NEOP|nr:hypothetical protein ONE63_000055 [Megalurothrips usitatus]